MITKTLSIIELSQNEISEVLGGFTLFAGGDKYKLTLPAVVGLGITGSIVASFLVPNGAAIATGIFAAYYMGSFFIFGDDFDIAIRKGINAELIALTLGFFSLKFDFQGARARPHAY